MSNRAALYVDGFNMYHAIDDLGIQHLKWLNLWRVGEILAGSRGHQLVKVVFCSAYYPGDAGKRARHEAYVKALKLAGVVPVLGHYVHDQMDCRSCGHNWSKPTEKETDINVALTLMIDGARNQFDVAYLVSADSDQAATARCFSQNLPDKKLYSVAPPGRGHSQHILAHTKLKASLDADLLERAVFPGVVPAANGLSAVIRPREYDPPAGWVHPNDRPKKA